MAFTGDNGKVCLGTDIQKMPCDVPMCERPLTKMFSVVSQGNAMGQGKYIGKIVIIFAKMLLKGLQASIKR